MKVKQDLQAIFENVPDCYLILDPDLLIVEVSNAYLRATMTKRGEIIGRRLFDVFPDNPDDPNATGVRNLKYSLQQVLSKKIPDTMAIQKYDIPKPGGGFEERSWSPVNTPVLDAKGGVMYIIHRVEDVTEYLRLKTSETDLRTHAEKMEAEVFLRAQQIQETNRELAEVNSQLEKASRMKSEFLANMSHELRTPLNAIIGFSEVLRDGLIGQVSAEQKEYLTDIFSSGQHLLSLINDILDLSKVESGKLQLDPEPVEVVNLLENGVTIVKESAVTNGVQLELLAEEMPNRIVADPRKLKQIIYNLLSNAVKFSPTGAKVTVRAKVRDRDALEDWKSDAPTTRLFKIPQEEYRNYIEISVTDQGPGINPEDGPKLFEAFSQVDTSLSREVEGTGLGLLLTLRLVRLHGGGMAMESTPGKGSTFTFWLPVHVPEADSENTVSPLPAGTNAGTKPTALVIEDDERAAELVRAQLKAEGMEVLVAGDAVAGFELLQSHTISLIILDILLPDIDGWEFLRQIKSASSAYAGIPVVILSILDQNRTGFTLGAAQVLQKPVSREVFHNALAALGFGNNEKKYHVLIIDDDRRAASLIQAYLPGDSYDVSMAFDGFSGIEAARAKRPDIIVLDLMMPDITGFGVLDVLRRDQELRNTPVIIVTGKSLTQPEREALKQQKAHLIQKSEMNQDNLMAEIRVVLQNR